MKSIIPSRWLWCALLCSVYWQAGAQTDHLARQAISSGGDQSTHPTGRLDWTLGQVAADRLSGTTYQLTEGFQQGELQVFNLTLPEEAVAQLRPDLHSRVFPNPASVYVQLETHAEHSLPGYWQLTDAYGRLLRTQRIDLADYSERIELAGLPAGSYRLQLLDAKGTLLDHFQIIKP